MFKINFFEPFVFIIHKICFSCSPINKTRYKDEHMEQLRYNKLELTSDEASGITEDKAWFWKLQNPIELFSLIKRYHMTGNVCTLLFFCHLLFLLHLTVKSIVHSIFTGTDRKLIEHFNSVYYPHMAGSLSEPYLFNNLFLAVSLHTLCIRSLSAYNLIRSSVINATRYLEFRVSQVSMSALTMYYMSPGDWYTFVKHSMFHGSEVRNDPEINRAHLKFNKMVQKQLPHLSTSDRLYYLNSIDFEECYASLGIFKLNKRKKIHQTWHCAPPCLRTSLGAFRNGALLGFTLGPFLVAGFLTVFFGVFFTELRSSFPPEAQVDSWEVLSTWSTHLSEPLHCLRLFELFLLIACQGPTQCDAVLVIMQIIMLISRCNKLIMVLEGHMAQLKSKQYRSQPQPIDELLVSEEVDSLFSHLNEPIYIDRTDGNKSFLKWNKRQIYFEKNLDGSQDDLNNKLKHDIKLIRLIYLEFVAIKRAESIFINLLIAGNAICITYCIALLFRIKTMSETIILSAALVNAIVPTINTLLICAGIEQTVSSSPFGSGRRNHRLYAYLTTLISSEDFTGQWESQWSISTNCSTQKP